MPPKSRQVGRGAAMSQGMDNMMEYFHYAVKEQLKNRIELWGKKKQIEWVQAYISKIQRLYQRITPQMRTNTNMVGIQSFPDYILNDINYRYIIDFILPGERQSHNRNLVSLYIKLIDRFTLDNGVFVKTYVEEYSKPLKFNIYAFYLLKSLVVYLDLQIRLAEQGMFRSVQSALYKNRLTTPHRHAFEYQWLKTDAMIKSNCKGEDDPKDEPCECFITMLELEPNEAFSVSYTSVGANGITKHTDCFHESVAFREEAMPYRYFRHPVLRDKFIDLDAIRALKSSGETVASVSASVAPTRGGRGAKKVGGATAKKPVKK